MASYLKDSGCTRPFIVLGLFDYLVSTTNKSARNLSSSIVFAGNLSKSGFIGKLNEVTHDSKISFILYGRNDASVRFDDKITYGGLFSPNDVSSIQGSWGLVWDGDSIDRLTGKMGLYQMINSPHKASLYLVAGLPIIVSKQVAISQIVNEEGIGFTVDSLYDIEGRIASMSDKDYQNMLENVRSYASRLMSGSNLMTALRQLS